MTITATAPAVTTRTAAARAAAPAVGAAVPTAPDADTLTLWGFAVENDGIDAHEEAASIVAEAARDKGLRPILVDILADRSEPSAARVRAFGRLAFALAR